MNRFEKKNAIEKIRGYYLPRPESVGSPEKIEADFIKAKQEAVNAMIITLTNLELINFEDFKKEMSDLGRPVL
jgi:hypothetical protein